mgnify:CR=1 FL=1
MKIKVEITEKELVEYIQSTLVHFFPHLCLQDIEVTIKEK